MKIVIDIPERDYDLACKYPNALIATYAHYIKGGTPYEERSQGEWINREAVSNTTFPFWERYECNKCHLHNGYSNFCPNCGADMRGGRE